jgi:hypothetical protein
MQHNCGFTYENREQACGENDATRIELVASCQSYHLPMKIFALLRCCIFSQAFRVGMPPRRVANAFAIRFLGPSCPMADGRGSKGLVRNPSYRSFKN